MNGNVELYTYVNSTRGGLVNARIIAIQGFARSCKLVMANPLREVRDFSRVELVVLALHP